MRGISETSNSMVKMKLDEAIREKIEYRKKVDAEIETLKKEMSVLPKVRITIEKPSERWVKVRKERNIEGLHQIIEGFVQGIRMTNQVIEVTLNLAGFTTWKEGELNTTIITPRNEIARKKVIKVALEN